MRFTKYGRRELVLFGGIAGALLIIMPTITYVLAQSRTLTLFVVFVFGGLFALVVSFFRDPVRTPPRGEHRLVAPADGMVFDIGEVDETEFLGERALRVGIFLSLFNCHVNRAPCSGRVEKIAYKKGSFFSSWTSASACSAHNESNLIGLSDASGLGVRIAVKQIAGRIARRIVCDLREGDSVSRGQAFGMIKFGSRTELFIPLSARFTLRVKVRSIVHGGRTVIATLDEVPAERGEGQQEPDEAAKPAEPLHDGEVEEVLDEVPAAADDAPESADAELAAFFEPASEQVEPAEPEIASAELTEGVPEDAARDSPAPGRMEASDEPERT